MNNYLEYIKKKSNEELLEYFKISGTLSASLLLN